MVRKGSRWIQGKTKAGRRYTSKGTIADITKNCNPKKERQKEEGKCKSGCGHGVSIGLLVTRTDSGNKGGFLAKGSLWEKSRKKEIQRKPVRGYPEGGQTKPGGDLSWGQKKKRQRGWGQRILGGLSGASPKKGGGGRGKRASGVPEKSERKKKKGDRKGGAKGRGGMRGHAYEVFHQKGRREKKGKSP